MVWILKKEGSDDESKVIKLLPDKEYVVGRKDVDIVLSRDQSISRNHGVIKVTTKASGMLDPRNFCTTTAILVDNSKYGTSVNGDKVTTGVDTVLTDGDLILFGVYNNQWRVELNRFVCCTSCLVGEEKTNVQRIVSKLGGQIVTEWTPQCSLLVMDKLTVTIKVVNVLASLCNIVTPKYLEDYYDAAKNNGPDPDIKNYVPPLEKSNVLEETVDFGPNETRKTVFRGVTFISFSSKQVKKLQFTLKRTGAELKQEDATKFRLVSSISNDDVCVVQPPKGSVSSAFESKLDTLLTKYNRRCVSEGEVGLAVLYCSRYKYCNPSLNKRDTNSFRGSLLDTQQPRSSHDTIYDTQASSIKTEQMDTFQADTEVESIHQLVENVLEVTDSKQDPTFYNISSSVVSETNEREVESSFEPSVPNIRTPKLQTPLVESKCERMEYEEEEEEREAASTSSYQRHRNSHSESFANDKTTNKVNINHLNGRKVEKIVNDRNEFNDDEQECRKDDRSYVVIKLVSLVRKKNLEARNETNGETVKNFKRFKKVFSKRSRILANNGEETRRRLEMIRSTAVVKSQPLLLTNPNSQNNKLEDECTDSANVFDWD